MPFDPNKQTRKIEVIIILPIRIIALSKSEIVRNKTVKIHIDGKRLRLQLR